MKKLLLLISISCSIIAANAQWQTNGPAGQTINCLAIGNAGIFAGSDSGIYLSTDNGGSWTMIDSGLTNININALAISDTQIFAGTEGGVFVSTNNGISWSSLGLSDEVITALAISGSNILAGTDTGVFLSNNNGSTWLPADSGLANLAVATIYPSGTNIFAGTQNGIYASYNNGSIWNQAGLENNLVLSIATQGSEIYAGTSGTFGSAFVFNQYDWISIDSGFAPEAATPINALAIGDSTQPGQRSGIFAGTEFQGVFLSADSGATWASVDSGLPANTSVYAIVLNGPNIFIGTSNGVWQSVQHDVISAIYNIPASTSSNFNLYPNPATNSYTIETTTPGKQFMQLYDMTGRLILTRNISQNKTTIDAGNLAAGLYTVSLKSADGVITEKLVLQR